MPETTEFDPKDFLPYLLNLAAEEASAGFQTAYKDRYSMLRTDWRVLFHLGRYGDMTAKSICDRARLHKTKVSRAVARLQERRFIKRSEIESDRRHALLSLMPKGRAAYHDLARTAQDYDAELSSGLNAEEITILRKCLLRLAKIPDERAT